MKNGARFVVFMAFTAFHCGIAASQTLLSGTVNSYYSVTAINSATNTVTVDNASGLSVGQRVLLYQAKGAAINTSNASTYGDISAANKAGAYEFNTICTISGNSVWLMYAMVNTYDPAGMVQLVTVPSGSSLTVNGTITSQPWDSLTGKGGIVALEASSVINLNADINVAGQGFEGGTLINWAIPPYNCSWAVPVTAYYLPYVTTGYQTGGRKGEGVAAYIPGQEFGRGKLASGGGGGNNANSGGGGGANYGAGGAGGQRSGEATFDCHAAYPGLGGASVATYGYSTSANRIFLGGGGGSGEENNGYGEPGGNGGGIIFLSAPTIIGGGGRLVATGARPTNPICTDPYQAEGDGGGGGGAGGSIVLNASAISGTISADASGANGSNSSNRVNDCTGPGGGGGGGAIWTAGAAFPGAVSATVNGGANGVVSSGNTKTSCQGSANGATAGAVGRALSGYTLPVSSGPVCVALASPSLEYFNATRSGRNVLLSWATIFAATTPGIRSFSVQRSSDLSHFETIATLPGSGDSITYRYTDDGMTGSTVLDYRLTWQNDAGEWLYSRIVEVPGIPGPDESTIRLYPDPAANYLTLTVVSTSNETATLSVSGTLGQQLLTRQVSLFKGLNTVSIPLGNLAPAAYFLVLQSAGNRLVKPFLKKRG
ncbi:MAG TPA: T9SS type A sorting domain-containing protein [Puia sp.]|nr:T9SS type A sorting domain-containing protein [Puia sp.]